jgi:outer membrane protein OmpA-like peptidoglycan-associated protein
VNEKGERSEDATKNGCPLPQDQDKDGILDPVDACPTVAGITSAEPAKHGCPPVVTDNDGDGIQNAVDACPDKPGVASAEPSANGCPQAKLVGAKIEILGRIEFETRRSELLPESEPILRSVLQVLQNQPSILRLSIEGHTDNRGAAATNESLSLRRAESVLAWLVIQGIDPARLVAQGYGPRKPIETNETEAGRRNNRRVEFNVLEFAKEQGGTP